MEFKVKVKSQGHPMTLTLAQNGHFLTKTALARDGNKGQCKTVDPWESSTPVTNKILEGIFYFGLYSNFIVKKTDFLAQNRSKMMKNG